MGNEEQSESDVQTETHSERTQRYNSEMCEMSDQGHNTTVISVNHPKVPALTREVGAILIRRLPHLDEVKPEEVPKGHLQVVTCHVERPCEGFNTCMATIFLYCSDAFVVACMLWFMSQRFISEHCSISSYPEALVIQAEETISNAIALMSM